MRHLYLKALVVVLLARSAYAWGPEGHMAIAAFAFDEMAEKHPAELAKILNVLHHHPEWPAGVKYSMEKRVQSVAPQDRDRYSLMIAGRWPDDIRPEPQYHHGAWHYVDFPVLAAGEHVATSQPAAENALTAIAAQADVLKKGPIGPDQGVALCWIVHLVGDLHQPLHTTSLFSAKFPDGDRGGNLIYIRVPPNGGTINLHQFWDGTLGTSANYRDAANEAAELRHRPDLARDRLPTANDGNPTDWAKESYAAAVKYAYLNGTLQGGTKQSGQMLPPDYAKTAKAVAEQRAALAGYRLTDTLVALAKQLP